jgi:hypothetical protein
VIEANVRSSARVVIFIFESTVLSKFSAGKVAASQYQVQVSTGSVATGCASPRYVSPVADGPGYGFYSTEISDIITAISGGLL